MNDLGLVETVVSFGESIVITVADAAHRRLDARLHQPLVYLIESIERVQVGGRNASRGLR